MATDYGKNYKAAYIDKPAGKYGVGEYNGNKHVQYEEHTGLRAVYAISDIIKLGKLPKGARVLSVTVKSASLGTTGIFNIGYPANGVDSADADAFVVGSDAGGQAVQSVGAGDGIGKKLGAETEIELVFTEATQAATGVVIKSWIEYILE